MLNRSNQLLGNKVDVQRETINYDSEKKCADIFVQIEGLSFDYYFGGAILEIFESSALMQNSWKQKKESA